MEFQEEDVVYINTDPETFGPGEWNRLQCNALRCRTPEKIKFFIQVHVPGIVSLLCSTCSRSAFELIRKRHPNSYKNKVDHRGEKIGMWLWSFDLHNDVNRHLKKKELTYEEAAAIYAPLLNLTTEDLEEESINISSPLTMDNLKVIEFVTDEDDGVAVIPHKEDEETPVAVKEEKEPILERQAAIKRRGKFNKIHNKNVRINTNKNKRMVPLKAAKAVIPAPSVPQEVITPNVVIPATTENTIKALPRKMGRRVRMAPTGRCTSCGANKK